MATVFSLPHAPPPPVILLLSMTDLLPAPISLLLLHTTLPPCVNHKKTPNVTRTSPRAESPCSQVASRSSTSLKDQSRGRAGIILKAPVALKAIATSQGLIERPVGAQLMSIEDATGMSKEECAKIQVCLIPSSFPVANAVCKSRIRTVGPTILNMYEPYTRQDKDVLAKLEAQVRSMFPVVHIAPSSSSLLARLRIPRLCKVRRALAHSTFPYCLAQIS